MPLLIIDICRVQTCVLYITEYIESTPTEEIQEHLRDFDGKSRMVTKYQRQKSHACVPLSSTLFLNIDPLPSPLFFAPVGGQVPKMREAGGEVRAVLGRPPHPPSTGTAVNTIVQPPFSSLSQT